MNWSSAAVRLKGKEGGAGLADVHEDLSYFQVFVSFSPFAGPFFSPPSQLRVMERQRSRRGGRLNSAAGG